MAQMPTEQQIQQFAKEIGAIGPDGFYTEPRNKLASGAQIWLAEKAKKLDAEPECESTVDALARLHDELIDKFDGPLGQQLARDLLVSMAPALVRRQGLQLKSKGNPR